MWPGPGGGGQFCLSLKKIDWIGKTLWEKSLWGYAGLARLDLLALPDWRVENLCGRV